MLMFNEVGRITWGLPADRITGVGRKVFGNVVSEDGRRILGSDLGTVTSVDLDPVINFDCQFNVESETSLASEVWDIKTLMPNKFQESAVMSDYLDSCNKLVNLVSMQTDLLGDLIDIDRCPRQYLGHLASLIAFKLRNTEYSTTYVS